LATRAVSYLIKRPDIGDFWRKGSHFDLITLTIFA